MTILPVHDKQQHLVNEFIKMAMSTIKLNKAQSIGQVYFKGQEMGFCNDEINILLEDLPLEQHRKL